MLSPPQEPFLSVRNLSTKLKIDKNIFTIVDQLNFSLYKGKTVALVGESGCGKSLTALSIMRILPEGIALPSTGEVIYQGKNLLEISEKEMRCLRGSKISMIFQDPMSALNPVYTIGNQLMEVAEIHLNLYDEEAWNRSKEALEAVGIEDSERRLSAYPHELSGGLKQRVMIAMALMCQPDLLIADEPTTALDVTIQKQILELIKTLQKERGMALLLITHDMGIVSEIADEVIVMYLAQGIEKGTLKEVLRNPSHPYTKGLFQSRPPLMGEKVRLTPILGQVPSFREIPHGCRFHPRCPYVMKKCLEGSVPNFILESPSHQAQCWLYEQKEREE